jgi:two-component system, response regulator YesN
LFKLLIADDEALERQALRYIIKKHCSEITEIQEASNGREAIEIHSTFRPQIILLDIKMPGINGIDAASKIKKENPACKIIFLTAFDYFEYARDAIKIGVENFIIKPAEDEAIVEAIRSLTDELKKELDLANSRQNNEDNFLAAKGFLEKELVASLVSGDFNRSQMKTLLAMMNINCYNGFSVIVKTGRVDYGVKEEDNIHREIFERRFTEKIKNIAKASDYVCLINYKNAMFFILLLSDTEMLLSDEKNDSINFVRSLYSELKKDIDTEVTIGIGREFHDIEGMSDSFSEAKIACSKQESKETDSGKAFIDKVCKYINDNYAEQITLDTVSNMIGFSSFYFSKIFKQYKNMNFIDYLTLVRINKSKELLMDFSISIKEISDLIGYNNPDYFTRVFKRCEGITPTEYRNKKMKE